MKNIAIIGGGPAGLMAAEVIARAGHHVTIYDQMSSVGRKLLMAGRGGLNLTHTEELPRFLARYGDKAARLEPALKHFTPDDLRSWAENLGQQLFVGTSGRVFPLAMKASPLLRAWLQRLQDSGVSFALNHRWLGWDKNGALRFQHQGAEKTISADAVLLALGGGSWAKLGSDGTWVEILRAHNIALTPLQPSNCGFIINWSDKFRENFSGTPLKPVKITFAGKQIQGEAMITAQGIEGGAIYALSSVIRDAITRDGTASLTLDLRCGLSLDELAQRLQNARGSQSLSTFLRKAGGLSPVAIGLLREVFGSQPVPNSPRALAEQIKVLPLTLIAPTTIDRAISTAGGISFDEVTDDFMLRKKPGVFVAGEMLDWEAPTGGYLLQATFSTAVAAANGMLNYLK